jgi:hypothetical protein
MSSAAQWNYSLFSSDMQKGSTETSEKHSKVLVKGHTDCEQLLAIFSGDTHSTHNETDSTIPAEHTYRNPTFSNNEVAIFNMNGRIRSKYMTDASDPFSDFSSTKTWYMTSCDMSDLPENFTANDCEELLASLDHLEPILA